MQQGVDNCYSSSNIAIKGTGMREEFENSDMTKEDRRRVLLEFMSEYDLALPPKAIHRNIRLKWNATFSYSSTHNYLEEFVEEGLAQRVEPKPLSAREIVEADNGDARAYYIITDAGHEYVA